MKTSTTTPTTEIWLEAEARSSTDDGDVDVDGWTDAVREWQASTPSEPPFDPTTDLVVHRDRRRAPLRRLEVLSDAPELLFRLDPLPRRRRRSKALVRRRSSD